MAYSKRQYIRFFIISIAVGGMVLRSWETIKVLYTNLFNSLDMREEMIRGKEAFGGCLFTGCACFFIGTILLVIFVFRDMIF